MGIYGALQQVKGKEFGAIEIQTEKFRPLPVFKQIMTMFCDINQGCMGDDSLRKFLLHKETTDFKKTTPNAIQKSKLILAHL